MEKMNKERQGNTGLYDAAGNLLSIEDAIKMLPLSTINRIEVIDEKGRSYVSWRANNRIELQVQDRGRTLKVFVSLIN